MEEQWVWKPDAFDRLCKAGYYLTPDTPFHVDDDPQRIQTLASSRASVEPVWADVPRDEFLARYMMRVSQD